MTFIDMDEKSAEETINLDQVAVERLVSDLRNNIAELQTLRLNPETAHYVGAELQNISAAYSELSFLAEHVGVRQPPQLRLVKR